jgi:hypothetical protein
MIAKFAGNRHSFAFAAMAVCLFVSTGSAAAAPTGPKVLIPSLLHRAEAGESVRSWYWRDGPSAFDSFDEPPFLSRYGAPPARPRPGGQVKKPRAQKTQLSPIRKPNRITCEAATEIVASYAFSSVKPVNCSGGTYEFQAMRADKPFSITLSAKNGELIKVKKNVVTALQ